MNKFLTRLKKRLAPLGDLTAWVMILLSLVPLALVDLAMVATLIQWTAYAFALAGVSVVVSRIVFPQIYLTEWIDRAKEGSLSAALVVLGITIFLGTVIMSMVLWAKT
jgi:hypothetical protein